MPRPGPLSLFAALILIATAAVAADALRGLESLLDFLHTDTVVAEATEIMKDGPQMALTEINNTTSNESSTTSIHCPFKNNNCCVQNTTDATKACVSSVCATIVSPGPDSDNTCADLVEALLAMYTSNPVPQGGTQTSVPTAGSGSGSGSGMTSAPSSGTTIVPTAGSGSGSGSGTTNMPTADSTLEPTEEPAADPTTEPTETADPIDEWLSEHNKYRCMHGAADLAWDADVAEKAQRVADRGEHYY